VHRFHEQIMGTLHTRIETAAAPFFLSTPFYPVAEIFRELLAWRGDESAEEQLARLEPAQITLNRLSSREVRAMVQQVAARKALSKPALTCLTFRWE
jgi:hypothetical protein